MMKSKFLLLIAYLLNVTTAVHVVMEDRNLTSVPQDINELVTDLYLSHNEITRITYGSFQQYKKLRKLNINSNSLISIDDGSFNNNAYLRELNAMYNSITHLPESFGLAARSLRKINLWDALNKHAASKINFTELVRVTWLNIGWANYGGRFDAAMLPPYVEYLGLNHANANDFPNFSNHTPLLNDLNMQNNKLRVIPRENLEKNLKLKELHLERNNLRTIPDFSHLPLSVLRLNNNPPLRCDQALCWIRMWPWVKTASLTVSAVCGAPWSLRRKKLMDVNPVSLGCHNGGFFLTEFALDLHVFAFAFSIN